MANAFRGFSIKNDLIFNEKSSGMKPIARVKNIKLYIYEFF